MDEDLQRLLGPTYRAISKMAIAAAFGQETGVSDT
jgi:hypothetical protein